MRSPKAIPMAADGLQTKKVTSGRYADCIHRTTTNSLCSPGACLGLRMRRLARTGARRTANRRDPNIPSAIVCASGRKVFPSTPCSVNSGRNTITMMSSERTMGRATSAHALRTR